MNNINGNFGEQAGTAGKDIVAGENLTFMRGNSLSGSGTDTTNRLPYSGYVEDIRKKNNGAYINYVN